MGPNRVLRTTAHVPDSEFSFPFVQGMIDRMGVSFFKYGKVLDAYPIKVSACGSLLVRLLRYLGRERFEALVAKTLAAAPTIQDAPHRREVGNTEYLMDVANFAMIEFMAPSFSEAYFESTDSDQSPGRMSSMGNVSQTANTLGQENVRRGGSNRETAGGFYKREGD